MNYEKALALYRNDKTLQLLRAEHFPLLLSFFHLAFKQQNRISYLQPEIQSLLADYIYSLEQKGIDDYDNPALDYLTKWSQQGYLRRYYEKSDDPVYELSPATENALKWLDDLNKPEFIGTHSRLLQFFQLLQQIVSAIAGPYERIKELEAARKKIDAEIDQIKLGNFVKPSDTQIKEHFFLAEETAKRLLADFRQVEENFRELDVHTRQTIIKSNKGKAEILDNVFMQQDYLWNTDQGKSFRSFWEFLMSERMQEELEVLLDRVNDVPAIIEVKKERTVDMIKLNLVDAGDKVNRSNDGLVEQLRKFVEQKNLAESRHILQNIENIEHLLIEHQELLDWQAPWMCIDGIIKPSFPMERPLFVPPRKVIFANSIVKDGSPGEVTAAVFDQFYVDMEVLKQNISTCLREKSQVSLSEVLRSFEPTKGMAEVIGYIQIAANEARHYIDNERTEELLLFNTAEQTSYKLSAPLIIYNR
ncbi:Protein of unknown function [Chitinophaga jiangningensis]|uniref:DUF3375 domain-containing protein n=1 Tax=Chitinophaga jiangningensis TaxID=1419482 RepID=A0A1M6YCC3_9BACT|nr:DUF3375 domain-containing protein [Chitinophaga jiangningensis]SHL15812.1 Protein of unknown function [Chitinophaga jiangningensis]